jgi:hypothetical protein
LNKTKRPKEPKRNNMKNVEIKNIAPRALVARTRYAFERATIGTIEYKKALIAYDRALRNAERRRSA